MFRAHRFPAGWRYSMARGVFAVAAAPAMLCLLMGFLLPIGPHAAREASLVLAVMIPGVGGAMAVGDLTLGPSGAIAGALVGGTLLVVLLMICR